MSDDVGEYIHISIHAGGKWHKVTSRYEGDLEGIWDRLWRDTGEVVKNAIERDDDGG